MTLQQLEYILAVNQFRHFAKAAEYPVVFFDWLNASEYKRESCVREPADSGFTLIGR